jgi:hypothetical protein
LTFDQQRLNLLPDMGNCGRSRAFFAAAILGLSVVLLAAASAPAAPVAADFRVHLLLGTGGRNVIQIPNGGSVTVRSLAFRAGASLENASGDPATGRLRLALPAGLRWGTDLPDPSEGCTSTEIAAECATGVMLDPANQANSEVGWAWDITASGPGSYVLTAEASVSSTSDPDPSSNSASATIVVKPVVLAVSATKISPARPRAGVVVTARVAVTDNGEPTRPSKVRCIGTVGGKGLPGKPRALDGAALCSYKTPKTATGKNLRGAVSVTLDAATITKRFVIRLR